MSASTSAATTSSGICPICKDSLSEGEVVQVRQKGADGINAASVQRGESLVVTDGCSVHVRCRQRYTNVKYIASAQRASTAAETRRSECLSSGPFNSATDCLFCGETVKLGGSDYSYVRTDAFTNSILAHCAQRSDEWSSKVKGRIDFYKDLHAAGCLYHHVCSVHFRFGRDVPRKYRDESSGSAMKRRKLGRPKDHDQEQAFLKLCAYLEKHDKEQFTMPELENKMREFLTLEDSTPYRRFYLKDQLLEHFGGKILITEGAGRPGIVTFYEMSADILRSFYQDAQAQRDVETRKRAIIDTAAKLILSDIKRRKAPAGDYYPTADELTLESALEFIPETLRDMLNKILPGEDNQRKVASIGQALFQAARPRSVIAPLQIGLASQLHHRYRSYFLLHTLSKMGFCSSYKEVLRFERNAASCATAVSSAGGDVSLQSSLLFAADNVDHNAVTLDGEGTFHGMGMIAAVTPGVKRSHRVTRKTIAELNVTELAKVDIVHYRFAKSALPSIKFKDIALYRDLAVPADVDILWEISFHFKQQQPNWQGMMHVMHKGHAHPGKSSIQFLPMIDMAPGDRTCIVSTLEFILKVADKQHVPAIITFDQPLYWKASEVIQAAPPGSPLKNIVLLLGSFHTLMNLLGAIGTLMDGTGLRNILEEVYAENTVVHMLSGKAVARAVRGHLLVDNCLYQLLLNSIAEGSPDFAALLCETEEAYQRLLRSETDLESIVKSTALTRIHDELEKRKSEVRAQSKTSKLWLGYQQMLSTARALIKADRTASWKTHLHAVYNALPIFAAAGHNNYLKSAYLYLQEMTELETKHPEVYRKFLDGLHVIRRTDQFWAGLGCDLVIEQTLMRSLKSSGGLTHGSRMTEDQRAVWTLSAPIMAEYGDAMQGFTELTHRGEEHHKESSAARIKRDASDIGKIFKKLASCSPYTADASLRNIVTGVVATDEVNVHELYSLGRDVVGKMLGHNVFTYAFKRRDKVKTMSKSSAVTVAPGKSIDPNLLFQRLVLVSRTAELDLENVMRFELSAFPTALFEASHIMRKADKPALAHAIADHCKTPASTDTTPEAFPITEKYVIDGGYLLRKLNWRKGDTYGDIAVMYADFVVEKYGLPTVVFDGYEAGPSVKDSTHRRRHHNFTGVTVFEGKRDEFLPVGGNKQQLIKLIMQELKKRGCGTSQADGDADVDIAKAAVSSAKEHSTTLIGEDTDLLILLLHYAEVDGSSPLYYRSDPASQDTPRVYDIKHLKSTLGSKVCEQLLFVHAFTGCDSTSRIYGLGKKAVFQKILTRDSAFPSLATAFTAPGKTPAEISRLGIQAMALIYGGDSNSSLAALRHQILSKKLITAKEFVTPERLPPTESSTTYHSLRVYFQTMIWKDMARDLNAVDWGWKLQGNELVPLMCDLEAAPDSLLQVIRCNCDKTRCSGNRCSCRRHGLKCSSACGSCQELVCDNQGSGEPQSSDEDD